MYILLHVPGHERQVEDKRHPVAVDQEQDGQERVDTSLGDNVHVQAVAEVDRVDVVAFQVRVHDREEDLQEEVDGIEEHGEEKQPGGMSAIRSVPWSATFRAVLPSFSSHFGGVGGGMRSAKGVRSFDKI